MIKGWEQALLRIPFDRAFVILQTSLSAKDCTSHPNTFLDEIIEIRQLRFQTTPDRSLAWHINQFHWLLHWLAKVQREDLGMLAYGIRSGTASAAGQPWLWEELQGESRENPRSSSGSQWIPLRTRLAETWDYLRCNQMYHYLMYPPFNQTRSDIWFGWIWNLRTSPTPKKNIQKQELLIFLLNFGTCRSSFAILTLFPFCTWCLCPGMETTLRNCSEEWWDWRSGGSTMAVRKELWHLLRSQWIDGSWLKRWRFTCHEISGLSDRVSYYKLYQQSQRRNVWSLHVFSNLHDHEVICNLIQWWQPRQHV